MKIVSSKAREVNCIRALVYGDSGIGKTTSIGTLPESQTLIAAAERGLIPLGKKDYAVATIESWDDVRELIRAAQKPPLVEGKEIKIIVLDSLSEVSELCKRQIVTVDRRRLVSERTGGKREAPEKVYEDLMVQEDWGLYRSRLQAFLGALCHLPYHVIVTCLASWTEDKQSGGIYRTPNLSGKLALEVPAYFDCVFHMESMKDSEGQDTRVFRTSSNGKILAKDASGILAPIEPANWTHIFKKILTDNNGAAKTEAKAEAKDSGKAATKEKVK